MHFIGSHLLFPHFFSRFYKIVFRAQDKPPLRYKIDNVIFDIKCDDVVEIFLFLSLTHFSGSTNGMCVFVMFIRFNVQ